MLKQEENEEVVEPKVASTAAEDLLNPETESEAALTALLLAHPNRLDYEYEANPYEHLPSRFLSMVPCPFVSLTRLGLSSAAASIRQTTLDGAGVKKRVGIPVPSSAASSGGTQRSKSATGAEKGTTPLTDAVARSFEEAAKITVESIRHSTRKTPSAVYEILPDAQLAENDYATASSADPVNAEPGCFFLTHPGTSQTCLYGPVKKPPSRVSLNKGDVFGVPMEMYNMQSTTNQAPKRWLLFAKEEGGVGALCKISGKRLQLLKERGLDVAGNATILLKVDSRRGGN